MANPKAGVAEVEVEALTPIFRELLVVVVVE